jgi:SAM-dependent methyltransferase
MFKLITPPVDPGLFVFNSLFEYDDFMGSVRTFVDLGCGAGQDLLRWASATTKDDVPLPLDIKCTGVDIGMNLLNSVKHSNIRFQLQDFENPLPTNTKFDVLWCNNSFQFCINPIQTLSSWWHLASENSMLVIIVPQTTNVVEKHLDFTQPSACYYHYTMVNLIHMLAVSGWDCRGGFFQKHVNDPWIYAVVYKSQQPPQNPKTTTWYQLAEMKLLPESAEKSIATHGELRQQDLVLTWLDHNLWLGKR